MDEQDQDTGTDREATHYSRMRNSEEIRRDLGAKMVKAMGQKWTTVSLGYMPEYQIT